MTREHAVLCVGLDWHLLSARMQILKAAGFQVVVARDDSQARIVTRFLRFHAVILCHSLHSDVQNDLTFDLRTVQPELPILELQKEDREPRKLIEAVTAVTSKKFLSHRRNCRT